MCVGAFNCEDDLYESTACGVRPTEGGGGGGDTKSLSTVQPPLTGGGGGGEDTKSFSTV